MRIIAILAAYLVSAAANAAALPSTFSSETLLEEVTASVDTPHAFDWREPSFELELGYGYIDEANNFENEVYQLGGAMSVGGGIMVQMALRRVNVYTTPSSNKIGRTPFLQAAGVTRYELAAGARYSLLEGRSMTRLSPTLTDLAHVLFFTGGVHYSHPNASAMIKASDTPRRLPGQDPKNTKIVLELGLRWQIYLPAAFGISFEASRHVPLGDTGELGGWTYFSGGLVWAVGAN